MEKVKGTYELVTYTRN